MWPKPASQLIPFENLELRPIGGQSICLCLWLELEHGLWIGACHGDKGHRKLSGDAGEEEREN